MKAVIYDKYGGPEVLKHREVHKPRPKTNEVLVKIQATTVTSGDVRLRSSDFPPLFWLPARFIFGLFKPKKKILGHEFSGVVEEVGSEVTKFQIGDAIFGTTTMLTSGSYAEYICVPEVWKHGVVTLKPKNLNHSEAAALPVGAMAALFLLEKAKINNEASVLVYGASGSVGSYAVQIAKFLGKSVTGVCSSSNIEMVKSLGANQTVDYTKQDYTKLEDKFDIVFDTVGKTSKSKARHVLKDGGRFVSTKIITYEKLEHLNKIKAWTESSHLIPYIDRTYALEDIVAAHSYVDSGRKRGNVVIKVV